MIRQRCHFSVIFESLWQFWAVILLMLFNEIDAIVDVVQELGSGGLAVLAASGGLWGLLGVAALTLIVLGIQFLRWRKTWITLDENLIILERNTLRKVRNTIAIENLSSVNIEQSLFERVVGTAKIKLDTGSMTTAAKTDLSIVLKKPKADAFRREILQRMHRQMPAGENVESETDGPKASGSLKQGRAAAPAFHAGPADMLRHCFFSLPLFSLLVTVAAAGGIVWAVSRFGTAWILSHVGGNLALLLIVAGCAWDLVKRFIIYYGFTVSRAGREIYLQYGLLKLKNYTIPVDQIVCMHVEQPLLSRIFRRYQASIVTVGLGNEDGETSNLTLALTEAEFRRQLSVLLPEYMGDVDFRMLHGEPAGVLLIKCAKLIKWAAIFGFGAWALTSQAQLPAKYVLPAYGAVLGLLAAGYLLTHLTAGFSLGERFCALARGVTTRHICICAYERVQHIRLSVHPLARPMHLATGAAHLLNAAAKIPYMEETQAFRLSEKIYRNEERTGFTGQNKVTQ